MQLEIHVLQSFAPANLNRDENGMPKSTVFGGRPRARISSQCQKRAARKFYQENSMIEPKHFAERSRAWMPELKQILQAQNIAEVKAETAAKLALEVLGAKFEGEKIESKTILFLGKTEIQAIADILIENWGVIERKVSEEKPALPTKDPNIPKVIEHGLKDSFKPGDVALFGRMMAALPTVNVDAAVQVAHALSVHALQQEFDFFTAVDDLGASNDAGADHMGETGYNSSTYYRFAVLDTVQLQKNLGSVAQSILVAQAFVEAFIKAIPSGHQNAFAAHSLPALVMLVVRKGQPISLVDAFENPVYPSDKLSLLEKAVRQFEEHWVDLTKMYGNGSDYQGIVTLTRLEKHLGSLNGAKKDALLTLLDEAVAAAFPTGG
ncbi:type I-E CRISPR-associated protein Cas7/Cse4/CasC [Anthocerotibacter panamensis]|uniref:type I-E CRISPR-associated protein Cas7/Cse4/CasC n=1 Tax=Anthocerotibacter panamensis TaxID=2857077 RepID=UPI001C406DC1|nr:type I-E CRISPR-associated protein Cas7/Cse4/CasC [Anthocerotibacter panamensis]